MIASTYVRKNIVADHPWNFNALLLGESGIGKTTLMFEACEKLVGEDGYLIFDCGKEEGVECINEAMYAKIRTFKDFKDTIEHIIVNKETIYPNLKIVVIDTIDQLFEITEPEAIRLWNIANQGKKDFHPVKTLNAAWDGFGKGQDKVVDIILNLMWKLKNVGVAFWGCGHTKRRENDDPVSGQTYSTLSTNMTQKYFNAIRTKFPLVGIAYIDRTLVQEEYGKINLKTNSVNQN